MHRTVLTFLYWVVGILGLVSCAHAGDPDSGSGWPQWRGPTFDSVSEETDIANSWPEAGPPVLWSRELGQGYSSFVAVGRHVFTLSQTLYEQAVVCLDADTGQTVWSTRYGWPYEGGGLYPGPRSTPTWSDSRIYFAAPDGTIGCLDAANGRSIWSTNPTKQYRGRGTDFGYSCSPLVVDGKVVVPVGGFGASVVALSAADGSLIWKSGDSSASYATPILISRNGKKLIVALLENSLAIFELETGRLVCEETFSSDYDEHSAAPLYREPLLMRAGAFRSGATCVRLDTSTVDGVLEAKLVPAWEAPKFSNDVASSVIYQGRIYGFDLADIQSRVSRPSRGTYRCLDFETGKMLWSTDAVGHANTIIADGKLILFNDRGEVILAHAGTDHYEELARAAVFHDEICWSAAALHRGRLYLRTHTQTVCLYLGSQPLQSAKPVSSVAAIPRIRSFDPTPLLGGERDFPATVPEWSNLFHWYLCSLCGIGFSLLISSLGSVGVHFLRHRQPQANSADVSASSQARFASQIAFWTTILVAGAIGSPLLNWLQSEYVFLWPLVLWAAMQLTLLSSVWAERQSNRSQARWISRVTGLLFFATCGLYFHLCRRLGLSIEWGFLTGFLPSFPVVAITSYGLLMKSRHQWFVDSVCAVTSFTAYFASATLFLKWWLHVGT